jgi:dihydroneopterin aldolase
MHEDKIVIKRLHCSVRLGVKKEEQEVRRNCEIDVTVFFDLSDAARTDDLDRTVNYSKVIDLILDLSQKVQYKLLEAFAYRLFSEIFTHTEARKVHLRVKKMNPPIEARFQYVGVEMMRERDEFIKGSGSAQNQTGKS